MGAGWLWGVIDDDALPGCFAVDDCGGPLRCRRGLAVIHQHGRAWPNLAAWAGIGRTWQRRESRIHRTVRVCRAIVLFRGFGCASNELLGASRREIQAGLPVGSVPVDCCRVCRSFVSRCASASSVHYVQPVGPVGARTMSEFRRARALGQRSGGRGSTDHGGCRQSMGYLAVGRRDYCRMGHVFAIAFGGSG